MCGFQADYQDNKMPKATRFKGLWFICYCNATALVFDLNLARQPRFGRRQPDVFLKLNFQLMTYRLLRESLKQ